MIGILIGIIGWWSALLSWPVGLLFAVVGLGSIFMHLRHMQTFREVGRCSKTMDDRLLKLERRIRDGRRPSEATSEPTVSPFEATPEMYEQAAEAVRETGDCACSTGGQCRWHQRHAD